MQRTFLHYLHDDDDDEHKVRRGKGRQKEVIRFGSWAREVNYCMSNASFSLFPTIEFTVEAVRERVSERAKQAGRHTNIFIYCC
jgi:hypothetical protein